MKRKLRMLATLLFSVMVALSMGATAFAYEAQEDDGDRSLANEESMHVVYSTAGMLRILDEGSSATLSDDLTTVNVVAKTSESKTWGAMTKIALIEQSATDAQKDEAAKEIVYDNAAFVDGKTSRVLTFSIPASDVGKKIPVSRYVSTSATEGAWKDFSEQQYFIVEKSAVAPVELTVENNVKMFKPEAASLEAAESGYILHLVLGSDSYDKVFVGPAWDADDAETINIEMKDGKGYVDIPFAKADEDIVLAFHGSKYFNRQARIDLKNRKVVFNPYEASIDIIDSLTEEEAIAKAKEITSVDLVNQMIEAIQVQSRNKNTDKYCAVARALYDALSDKDKEKLEDDGYFSDDTGDAKADVPLNTAPDKTKELLVVSFGTSFNDSRAKDIGGVEKALAKAYPDYCVRRAFTAQIIINHIQARDGVAIDNMDQALEKAIKAGVKELIIQPTHLMYGAEFDELAAAVKKVEDKFQSVTIAEPLLGQVGKSASDINADKAAAAKAMVAETVKVAKADSLKALADAKTAIVFMGHGTGHDAAITYDQMQAQMKALGYKNVFVGTVEGNPADTALPEVKKAVEAAGFTKVILRPMMVVAGDHANNDMADPEEGSGSWYDGFVNGGQFEVEGADQPVDIGKGFGDGNVTCQIEGLGRIAAIQKMYVAHTGDVVAAPQIAKIESMKITLKSVKAGKKKATVKWKKSSKVDGYQISYKVGKKTKKVKASKAKTTKKVIKKLKAGKKYTVKVRGYKKINGKLYYTKWSKAKKVKIKK